MSGFIKMSYHWDSRTLTIEDTDIKEEYIDDFLEDWIYVVNQQKLDRNPLVEKDVYSFLFIVREERSRQRYIMSHDAGNQQFAVGIIATSVGKWRMKPTVNWQKEGF